LAKETLLGQPQRKWADSKQGKPLLAWLHNPALLYSTVSAEPLQLRLSASPFEI
jgi:hypothetical protein